MILSISSGEELAASLSIYLNFSWAINSFEAAKYWPAYTAAAALVAATESSTPGIPGVSELAYVTKTCDSPVAVIIKLYNKLVIY